MWPGWGIIASPDSCSLSNDCADKPSASYSCKCLQTLALILKLERANVPCYRGLRPGKKKIKVEFNFAEVEPPKGLSESEQVPAASLQPGAVR